MAAVYAKNIILEINITEIKCEYIFKFLLDLKLTISLRINEKNNILYSRFYKLPMGKPMFLNCFDWYSG